MPLHAASRPPEHNINGAPLPCEIAFDPANVLAQTRQREFDALNRLAKDIGAQTQTTRYEYDAQGNHCIAAADYAHAVALAYTCLEGFYKAFVVQNLPDQAKETEIIALAKCIKKYLSETIDSYPDEALSMVMHVSHTVDRARNRFSEAHFEEEAARWLAVYVRDLANTQIRLLLHFF